MSVKRAVIAGIGIVLLVGLFISFYWFNKPRATVEDVKADYTLSASELYNAYEADEAGSDQKYLNKVLEVSGQVTGLQQNDGSTLLQLGTGNTMGGISCRLVNDKDSGVTDVANKMVTIKGRCTGFLMDVNLVDCIIVHNKQ